MKIIEGACSLKNNNIVIVCLTLTREHKY